ncbi:hypothetical protein [Sulfuriferula nivalis]|uniref:Uncharacterized protein n=1 Tax=Sulfuriferula nivalis TaxID=2675298 RepID=A0A809RGP6_9PROT|nr:hypothetical protein [Sulfuriferula nivalis]BBP00816.1 hypothetical protein SFSGTM_15240 [Sulfuriferula nivalis]
MHLNKKSSGQHYVVRHIGMPMLLGLLCIVTSVHAAPLGTMQADLQLLNRITYGVNTDSLKQYQALGHERYLQSQRIRLDCDREASHNLNRLLDKPGMAGAGVA